MCRPCPSQGEREAHSPVTGSLPERERAREREREKCVCVCVCVCGEREKKRVTVWWNVLSEES